LVGCWLLVLICSKKKVLLTGGWFVVREKYCWLVVDKPDEQRCHVVAAPGVPCSD
jgi:hypothetical protein